MAVEFFWPIPINGDGRSALLAEWDRGEWTPPGPGHIALGADYSDYLVQVGKAADVSGFDGVLIPSAWNSEEPFVLAAIIARETKRLRLMPAFQPGFLSPMYAAKISTTLQRMSGGRLEWNVITGGSPSAQQAYGDFTPHDERYARTAEFLDVVEGIWHQAPFTHEGKLYRMENGGLPMPQARERKPGIYFSGASEAALEVAARHADVYLMWLETMAAVRDSAARVRGMAARFGRTPRIGVRVDIFARETEEEAWAEARRMFDIAERGAAGLATQLTSSKGGESVGAQRQAALRPAGARTFEDFVIGPNLWAGLGTVRPGPTVGIFGSYRQVADRLGDLIDAGVSNFILAANPHLEEAFRVGQCVLPLVREQRKEKAALLF
jgi:alkanesulfonate monooxygenase